MCTTPLEVTMDKFGTTRHVQCRKCDECMAARKRHWIGRLMAQEQTSIATWFCTFTYGGGDENDKAGWLDYSDLQKTFKKMRRAGHKFKYLAVGEYGSKNSRAHWHAIIYWLSTPPDLPLGVRLNTPGKDPEFPSWEHGIVQFELPRSVQGSAAYMMTYLDKDALKKGLLKYSTRPALGEEYLMKYAAEHAAEGVALFNNGNHYTVPNNPNQNGKPFFYPVEFSSSMFHKMCKAYLEAWAKLRPNQRLPLSPSFSDWMVEIAQDPEDQGFSRRVLAYLCKQYDLTLTIPYQKTITVFDEGWHIETTAGSAAVVTTKEDHETWRENLGIIPDDPRIVNPELKLLALHVLLTRAPQHGLVPLDLTTLRNELGALSLRFPSLTLPPNQPPDACPKPSSQRSGAYTSHKRRPEDLTFKQRLLNPRS